MCKVTFRMYWMDPRVKIRADNATAVADYVTLNPIAARSFWIPDIFIDQVSILFHVHERFILSIFERK